MNAPLVSIIIPTYNRSGLLGYTLDSIVRQSVPAGQLEVLVVDDGSTDDTAAVVRQYRAKLPLKYLYQEHQGRRVSRARNLGIEHATGGVCLFVDSGILLGSGCVARHVQSHQAAAGPACVIGYVYCFDNDNHQGTHLSKFIDPYKPDAFITYFRYTGQYRDIREPFYKRYRDQLSDLPAPWVFFWTCNVSVNRRALQETGAFDVRYDQNWGMEDIDLGYRLHKGGVQTVLDREAHSIHFPHEKVQAENDCQHAVNQQLFHQKYNTPETELFLRHTWELNEMMPVLAAQRA